MKKIKFIVAIVTLFFSYNAMAQKEYLTTEEIPQKISTYINEHFPDNTIVYGKKKIKTSKAEYEVKLKNDIEIEFDGNMEVKEIESDIPLPQSVVPKKIWDYVASNYPNNKIFEWKKKRGYQKVELDNDYDLYFDLAGNFTELKR